MEGFTNTPYRGFEATIAGWYSNIGEVTSVPVIILFVLAKAAPPGELKMFDLFKI
jgi:hypothetical protein